MTNPIRRFLSVAFALALLLSLALPAFAEGTISGGGSVDLPAEDEQDPPAVTELFVSSSGDDGNDGSEDAPLASLAAAAMRANDAQTYTVYIILLSDITVTRCARFQGKNVILMSNEGSCVISRGGDFEAGFDALRRAYNPAMIELGDIEGSGGLAARLRLENVVLDDMAAAEGEEFAAQSLAPESEENNLERVQDAIIGVYGGSILTLNPGAVLRNFGGMSAVRALGGSTVVVEDDSSIADNTPIAAPEGLLPISSTADDEIKIGTNAIVLGHFQREEALEEALEAALEGSGDDLNDDDNPNDDDNLNNNDDSNDDDNLNNNDNPNDDDQSGVLDAAGSSTYRSLDGQSMANLLDPQSIGVQSTAGTPAAPTGSSLPDLTDTRSIGGGDGSIDLGDAENALTFTVDKAELYYDAAAESYKLVYTLKAALSETLVKLITAAKDSMTAASGSLTVTLDNRMTLALTSSGDVDCSFQSELFRLSDTQDAPTERQITLKIELADAWKSHLDTLSEPFTFVCSGVLPKDSFTNDDFLSSRGRVNSLSFEIGGQSKEWNSGSVEKEAQTKMLPPPSVTLVYEPNGGEGGPGSKVVSVQTNYALESENVPTHADVNGTPVVFIGWTAQKDTKLYARGESAPETLTTIDITADVTTRTVYACYGIDENEDGIPDVTQRLVQLSFDANGGSGAPEAILAVAKAEVGASIDIPELEPVRKFYTFQGWDKDASTEYDENTNYYKYNSSKKAKQDILIVKDTVLYAVWKQNPSYTLYYNANGGSGAPEAQTGIADENDSVELTISSVTPIRNGYTFLGWAVSRSGNAAYFAGNNVKITGGNVTLYAAWQRNGGGSYNNGGGGSGGAGGNGSPRTGDEAPVALYVALAVISLGAVGAGAWLLFRNGRKKR